MDEVIDNREGEKEEEEEEGRRRRINTTETF